MATIAITNLGPRNFQHPILGLVPPDGVTRTYTLKLNEIDYTRGDYDNLAKFGVIVAENGTARPGSIVVTTTANVTATQQCVLIDATTINYVLTLPTLASVPVGHSIFFYVRTNTSATITVDGNGAETVLGNAGSDLTAAGQSLRIMKENATNWKAFTV